MSETFAFCAVLASALLWAATAVAWAARQGAFAEAWRNWAGLPRLRKVLSLVALAALVSWAGMKPDGEIIELSNNRIIESADGAGLSSVGRDALDAPQDEAGAVVEAALSAEGLEGHEGRQGLEAGEERSRLEVEVENGTVNLRSPPSASTSTSSPPSASTSTSLILPVPRGQTTPLYLRADSTLSVSFSSDDFAFGLLPDLAASRLSGRINFPNVTATVPCFHDYAARRTEVTLPVGADADALTCTWSSDSGKVAVENAPPRSALLTGNFDGRATTPVFYTLAHPDYLFEQTTHSQTARFCPPPPEEDDEDGHYGEPSESGERNSCGHCLWELCSRDCDCCAVCPHRKGSSEVERPDDPSEDEDGPKPGDYDVAAANCPRLAGVQKIREPLLFADTIRLEVPDGDAPRCCLCPDHATNFVAVVYKSGRLKVVDADGLDFTRATETVDVRLAGVSPSREVGDAFLSFATNGVVCREGEYTVFGVDVRGEGVDLAALNALNASFGLPVPVTTNAADAATLALVTDVGLSGGNVHVGFEGASAPFALWVWDSASNDYRRLASSEDGGGLDVSLATWRKLVGGATDSATSRTPVRVTAAEPGAADLVFRYWAVVDGKFVEDTARQRLTAVDSPLRADASRDGKIDATDAALSRAGRPFRFWFNEDAEKGDYAGQVADATPNASDLKVNGKLDLVNLFPVVLDVSQFRRAWGAAATARLRAGTSARLRYCVLGDGFSSENASGLATAEVATADGTPLEEATLTPLDRDGVNVGTLSGGSLTSPLALAFEATGAVDGGLTLDVLVGGSVVYSCSLPMAISSVDEMYRYADLRGAAENAAFAPTVPTEPWNGPDGETDGRHFVFVHGYNVDAASSRAWARSMFKRLWRAGSRAAFTAVDWKGDSSQVAGVSPNYWANVVNAFKTAPALAELSNALPGEKVLIAHSLGNVLVSEACRKHGLSCSAYYMLNAAVPVEAYDGNVAVRAAMKPAVWRTYDDRILSANWHAVFSPEDGRRALAWRGRFEGLHNAVNCYSPTDEVLMNPALDGMGGAWSAQEILKGTGLASVLPSVANEGGWGFNRAHTMPLSATELRKTEFADDELKESPPFLPFAEDWLHATNAVSDTQVATVRARILADGIPATSFAAGANAVGGSFADVNCHDLMANKDKWPGGRKIDDGQGGKMNAWRHSDVKSLAYPYVYPLFRSFIINE